MTYLRVKRNEISTWIKEAICIPLEGEILKTPINKIVLSARASNALAKTGIETISDFMLFGPEKLCKVKNVGKKTIYEIGNVIKKIWFTNTDENEKEIFPDHVTSNSNVSKYIAHKPDLSEKNLRVTIKPTITEKLLVLPADKLNLTDAIEIILSSVSPKNIHIIKARYGYDEGKRKTLEEIGNRIGVTRERIRQILVKEIRRMKHPARKKIFQTIIENVERLLLQYKGVMSINDLAKDKYFVSGTHKELRFLMNLIVDLYEERYRIINKYFLTSLNDDEIKALQSKIREEASKCLFPIDEKVFIENIVSSVGPTSEDYLVYHLLYKEHLEISKGKVLSPGRLSIPQRVKVLMKNIDRPMHFTETAKLYRNYYGESKIKTKDLERAIHTRIGDSRDFIIVGPGTFMLRENFEMPDNIKEIVEFSKEILQNLQNITDTKHLINELKKRNIDIGNLNAYSLKPILLEYPEFISYRKFEIGLEKLADKYERKSLGDLIYEILVSSLKPMHIDTIWGKILKQRGFPRYAIDQRLGDDPKFIRVGPAKYTVAQNIPQYEEKQKIIINFAKDWINLKKNPISAFLVSEVLKETSEYKDLTPSLVEHVLAMSSELTKLPNGFYDLTSKEKGKIIYKIQ